MDRPFDVLAKTIALAEGMPRREAVRRVGGALALAGLSWLGAGCGGGSGSGSSPLSPLPPGTSGTGRAPQGGGNSNCAHFCQKAFATEAQRAQCVSDGANGTGLCAQCNNDITRLCNGVCCAAGQSCCGGTTCVDLQADIKNCGACGTVCGTLPALCCGGVCVNPDLDSRNCGGCGNVCRGGTICDFGRCHCPPTMPLICNTGCVNPRSDVNNCGSCGNVCSSGQICCGGICSDPSACFA